MIQHPKKGGHDGRSKKELNEHVPNTFLLIQRDDCCPVVNIDISEASNDQGDGPVEGGDKVVVTNSQETEEAKFVHRTENKLKLN